MAATEVFVEILYPDTVGASGGTWHDITSDALARDSLSIRGGREDESRRISPCSLNLTLRNVDGKYSPRNPSSPLYGLIGRNTPIRVSTRLVYDTFTRTTSSGWGTADSGHVWATSNAALSTTGTAARWTHTGTSSYFNTLNSSNGQADVVAQCTVRIGTKLTGSGAVHSQMLLRFQDSANYYTFGLYYQASGTATGPVGVVMGKTVAGSFTSSYSNFSFDVYNGSETFNLKAEVVGTTIRIKVWRTTVSEPAAWTAEATDATFSSGQFAMLSRKDATITSVDPTIDVDDLSIRSFRFTGEVESWPQSWDVSGKDVYVPITANGITRRLNAPGTTKPSLSALYRTLSLQSSNLLGWWPLENVTPEMTSAPSALTNGAAAPIVDASVTRSTDDSFPGADLVPQTGLGTGNAVGATNYGTSANLVPLLASTGDSWSLLFWTRTRLAQDAGSTTTVTATVKVSGSPQIDTWFFTVRQNNFGVAARVELDAFAVNTAGSVVTAVSFASGFTAAYVDAWRAYRVNVDLSGPDHRLRVWLDNTLVNTVTAASNTPGQPSAMAIQTQVTTSPVPISIGHVLFSGGTGADYIDTNATTLVAAGTGYVGDTASARMTRLCSEEGVSFTVDTATSEAVGVQRVAPFLDLMFQAAEADGGLLYEPRSSLGLAYQTQYSLYNQAVAGTLNYAAGGEVAPDLRPVEDTDATGNDIVVTRFNGGSARATKTTGTLNVQEPPSGVGRYRKDVTLVLYQDSQALQQAAWLRHLGTWDEARFPIINVSLTAMQVASKTTLRTTVLGLRVGGRLSITNPPAWLPPDSIEQRIQGYREEIGSHHHTIAFNATPAGPYDVYQIQSDTTFNRSRIPAADGETTLFEALTSGQTRMVINSTTVKWIDSIGYAAQFPFDIAASGERMRVTASANYLNANPFFESPTNTTNWTSQNGATLSASGAQFHEGAQSLLVTPNGVSFAPQATSEEVPAVAGRTYTVSGWIRSTGAATRKLGLFWYDAAHSLLSSNEISIALSAGVWTQYGPTGFTAPANTAFLRIFTNDPSNPLASNTWFLDEATVTSGNLQVFTVTRSINTVTKAQTAGTAVQLFRPPVIAR